MKRDASGKIVKHPIRVGQHVLLVKAATNLTGTLGLKMMEPYKVLATSLSGKKARTAYGIEFKLGAREFLFKDRDGDIRKGSLDCDRFGRVFEILKEA